MKSNLMAMLAAVAVLLTAGYILHGQPAAPWPPGAKEEARKIETSGTATVRVKADAARIFFAVMTHAKTIEAARTENAAAVHKVRAALVDLKIPDLRSKTGDVHLELIQKNLSDDRLPTTVGYRITHSFTVLVLDDDPEKLAASAGKVLDAALANGANHIQQIVFFRQEEKEARRQALAKAVEDALANAKALAAGGKVNVRDTLTIQGEPTYYSPYRQQMYNNVSQVAVGGNDGGSSLQAGEIEITCQVRVTCGY